jgi:hypothetical protein
MAGARVVEKGVDVVERAFFGFAREADTGEVHGRGAADDAEPFAPGGHAVVRLRALLPRAFEALVVRACENEHRLANVFPGIAREDRSGARGRESDVSIEEIFSSDLAAVELKRGVGTGFKHHRVGSHGMPEQNFERMVALLVGPGERGRRSIMRSFCGVGSVTMSFRPP